MSYLTPEQPLFILYCHVICKYVGLTLFVIIKLNLIFVIFKASDCEQFLKVN